LWRPGSVTYLDFFSMIIRQQIEGFPLSKNPEARTLIYRRRPKR
jgi:hypothetical protein